MISRDFLTAREELREGQSRESMSLTCSLSKAGPGRSGSLLQEKGPTMEEGQQRKQATGRDGREVEGSWG